MKKFLSLVFVFSFLYFGTVFAGGVDLGSIEGISDIKDVSNGAINGGNGTALEQIQDGSRSILHTVKIILSGIMLIYLVYLGFQMIMAMGTEDKLTTAKRQLYYTLVAFLFINVPGSIYDVFSGKDVGDVTDKTSSFTQVNIENGNGNIFINWDNWNSTVENGVINFVKIIVVSLVIMQFMMAGIGMISSAGNDEKRKKARTRFLNGIYGLIFIGIIHAWIGVVYSGDIPKGQGIFAQIANLAIFFAGPVAIFFLIMGGFYYITSAGDEAKAKKGMMIIKNTFVAVIILLACYAFLKDLASFTL